MYGLLVLNFIVPVVMLMAVLMLKKMQTPYPGPSGSPKWKIDFSGYNTPLSRKNKDHWDYAQVAAQVFFLRWGIWSLVGSILMTVLGAVFAAGNPNAVQHTVFFGVALGFFSMIAAFRATEKNIKMRFGE